VGEHEEITCHQFEVRVGVGGGRGRRCRTHTCGASRMARHLDGGGGAALLLTAGRNEWEEGMACGKGSAKKLARQTEWQTRK